MAHADNYLQWMAQRVLGEDQICHPIAERTPDELTDVSKYPPFTTGAVSWCKLTTVRVSIHKTSVSEVMYRESERAYSFHN